ncbi:unnamed protein product [Allacma fusca]|uniref:Uncharacterized protein n=1 Tax=Allacma fusca TaxID=39272 RepID=A0A8J2PJU1_9HEXA|nr:unnamed protein product [Allacma fusca]
MVFQGGIVQFTTSFLRSYPLTLSSNITRKPKEEKPVQQKIQMNFGKTFLMMILLVLALTIVPFGHSSPCNEENPCRTPGKYCNCATECCSRSCFPEAGGMMLTCHL